MLPLLMLLDPMVFVVMRNIRLSDSNFEDTFSRYTLLKTEES